MDGCWLYKQSPHHLSRSQEVRMSPDLVMQLGRQTLELLVLISSPLLLTALFVGLIVSLFQAATQINEMTLSFIPKLVGMIVALALTGYWMIDLMMQFTINLYSNIPNLLG